MTLKSTDDKNSKSMHIDLIEIKFEKKTFNFIENKKILHGALESSRSPVEFYYSYYNSSHTIIMLIFSIVFSV